jgi:hypothetical protein
VRAMALKLHPDVGGSTEDMVRLNRCAADLRAEFNLKPMKSKPVRKMRKSKPPPAPAANNKSTTERKRTVYQKRREEELVGVRRRAQMRQAESWGCWTGDLAFSWRHDH